MAHTARGLAAATLLAAAGACTYPATDVVVAVSTDVPADRPLTIRATLRDGAGLIAPGTPPDHTWTRGGPTGIALPASFGLRPRGGAPEDEQVSLLIEGVTGDATIRRLARFRFVPHESQLLRVSLELSCTAADTRCAHASPCTRQAWCEERGQTCGDLGDCVPLDATLTSPDAGAAFDGSARDVPRPTDAPDVVDVPPTDGDDVSDAPAAVDVPAPIDTAPPPPECGDHACNGAETTCTCPADCGGACGDACCNSGETTASCPGDCGTACGDGACNGGETTCNCPADCGTNPGDGCCNGAETCHEDPSCDQTACTCRVDCCYGTGGAEFTYQPTSCGCHGRYVHCTGMTPVVATYQIHYGGVLIYERVPYAGSYCGTNSSQGDNTCH